MAEQRKKRLPEGQVAPVQPPGPPAPAAMAPAGAAPGLVIGPAAPSIVLPILLLLQRNVAAQRPRAGLLLKSSRVSSRVQAVAAAQLANPQVAAPTIDYGTPAAATEGVAYSLTPTLTGTGVTCSVTSGSLPAGLSLNSSTGAITGTPTAAGDSTFTVTATNAGGSASQIIAISVAAGGLLYQLTQAAGTAPTSLIIAGTDTYKNSSNEAAADGDRVYQINSQVGTGRYFREGAASKGGILRASGANGVGDKPAIEFDNANSEFFLYSHTLADQYAAEQHALVALVQLVTPDLNSSDAYINDGLVGNSSGGVRPFVTHRNTSGGVMYAANGASGGVPGRNTSAVHGTGAVIGSRHHSTNGYTGSVNKSGVARTGSGNTTLTNTMRLYRHATYASGKLAVLATWNVDLTDAQYYAVVDVLRSYAGLSAIADP